MPEIRAETGDVSPCPIVAAGIALVAIVVCMAAASYFLLRAWDGKLAGANARPDFATRAPPLETAPQDDRARFDAEKRALLERYGWTDKGRGIARIPIDRAMDVLAAREAKRPVGQ